MIRTSKKMVLIPIIASFLGLSAFAYDGTVIESSKIGNYPENTFVKAVSNDTAMIKNILKEAFPNNPAEIVYQLKYENLDEDNKQVIGDVENYIYDQFRISDKDTYFHIVMKDNTKSLADGWVIYTNYTNEYDFVHVIYYFSLR